MHTITVEEAENSEQHRPGNSANAHPAKADSAKAGSAKAEAEANDAKSDPDAEEPQIDAASQEEKGTWRNQVAFIGGLAVFSATFFKSLFRRPLEFKEIVRQTYQIGYRSITLVAVVGAVIGAVLTMQSRPTMRKFGAEGFIPALVAISVMRELSPVLISIIVAGRVGAGIGAELGSMKVTEQIDAMEVAALDPFKYLVTTRVLACMIAVPILVAYGDFLAVFGSYFVSLLDAGMSLRLFINSITSTVSFADVLPGLLKSAFFGFTIGIVGCYEGFHTEGGTEGVGRSATDAAVASSLLIIVLDVLFVKLTLMLFG